VGRFLLICLGGAIGTGLRYVTAVAAVQWFGAEFPYGTLIANLVGAFLIGLIQQLGLEALMISDDVRLFLTTGVLGGLTTYSTFSYETVRMMEASTWLPAWVNLVVTTAVSLSLCFLGIAAGRGVMLIRG
jgi:fluoride exporter